MPTPPFSFTSTPCSTVSVSAPTWHRTILPLTSMFFNDPSTQNAINLLPLAPASTIGSC
ncbi:hypothetical protein LINPERPRIM_LOCUS35812, partial [Linum perenne]